ncbi:aldehyde dehydrogenase PuuC [Halioglobus japonicus]|uniref:Aldehyde dehydrogenase n=1 Tax=Halioglobus japonicus TaxID=930805 RepID=A0AAP8MGF8_9GAMM|nr:MULTISPECIES: aldehyde dehydrogenase [Halioglobus]AQA19574.1 aldehyde dehydrogenase PuuC [Halioglobus japonicus]KZX60702.1 aldehyde dehydrogenase [Halioglobus sp. HI00S01]PLW87358.1 aldehyde dehydrogenase [Halioglobus japonicus]GHD08888.1 aldehyde dehydrogenase [Halioglobus japonicus]
MTEKTLADWQQAAADIRIDGRAFINGRRVDAASGQTRTTYNPATGQALAEVANCAPADADEAVRIARETFEQGTWAGMPAAERKMVLVRWAELIEQHADELALLETLDVGKPIADTVNVDVPSSVRTIRWTGEAIDKVYDQISPTRDNCMGLITRLPLGVVAAIVPWNFPLSTTAWKLAPALATGNSVILKPASNTPLTALRIADLATQAGLPDGVLHVLPGPGGSLGEHIATHMGIDGLTFTGSTPVGKQLMVYSGQSNLKRVFLELGGKSPNIVFPDADIDKAASAAALAVYYNGGQTCTAGTRLIVHESIHDTFIEKVIEAASGWAPGNPLDPATAMGPMVDKGQCDTVAEYVAIGRDEGAKLVAGGGTVMEDTGGHYHEPTIFAGVNNQMRIAQEEIFGPVLAVIPFSTESEAVAIANDSIYGLAGAVWSQNINTAHRVAEQVRVGTMGINNYFGGDITVPFGGFKESGNGRDKSMHAFDDYTELKTTWLEFD